MDALASLASPWAYVVVGLLAALEASAFVGLFVPGELALLLGGYLAHQGRVELVVMMAVATAGAIGGDSLGYEIGRHLGDRLRTSRLGQRVGEERWRRAESYLAAKGGRAVFVGRFVGVLRALVPALAGASRLPYRRFLLWNALGGLIWAPGTVLLGYVAGDSYRRIEHYAGRASVLLVVAGAMIAAIVAGARWVARHGDEVRQLAERVGQRPVVGRFVRRYRAQLNFLVRRLRPGRALGLALTLQLVALMAAGWAFGSLVQDVIAGDEAARIDGPVARYVVTHRVDWLTDAMRVLTWLGSSAVLVPLVVVVGVVARRMNGSWRALVFLAAALAGGALLDDVVKPLVGRPRPALSPLVHTSRYAFPSGHALQAFVAYGGVALVASRWVRRWTAAVALWTVALLLALVVGFSRVYLGVHWPTDVLGGYALGTAWIAAVAVTARLGAARIDRRPPAARLAA